MSLFDSIKYPVSNPPTVSELRAIPPILINRWININGWTRMTVDNLLSISIYCTLSSNEHITQIVSALRKIIEEYDEPL